MCVFQHAHIENIETVANLSNNKDVFMCILRFHARAGYLQHYEALLKELISPQSGWSTYTGLLILSCVGFQPNWQSGLVKTCRMSWAFPTKLIRGQSLAVVGPLQS